MKSFKLICMLFFLTLTKSMIIEIECQPNVKTCIEDIFTSGEPISVSARLIGQSIRPNYFIAVSMETNDGIILENKRIDPQENKFIMVHNNEIQRTVKICVQNFETTSIFVELDLKTKNHLIIEESAPNLDEYGILDEKLETVLDAFNLAEGYLRESEQMMSNVFIKEDAFGGKIGYLSLFLVIGLVLIGIVQVKMLRIDFERKKNV